jgi:hypothetical protein
MTTIQNNSRTPNSNTTGITGTTQAGPAPAAAAPPGEEEGVEALPADKADPAAVGPQAKKATPAQLQEVRSALAAATKDPGRFGRTSKEDSDKAASLLNQLPARDFNEAMRKAGEDPEGLQRMLGAMSPHYRDGLANRMRQTGLVEVQPAPGPAPPGIGPTPPRAPALLKDDPALPRPLRDLAFAQNEAAAQQYGKEFRAYREAYGKAVDATKTTGELRALGPMQPPQIPENNPTKSGVMDTTYSAAYRKARGVTEIDVKKQEKVANKIKKLTGKPVAGISLEGKFKFLAELKSGASVGVEVTAKRGADGTSSVGATAQGKAGPIEVELDHTGKVKGGLKAGPLKASIDTDGKVRAGVSVEGAGSIEVGEDGVELEYEEDDKRIELDGKSVVKLNAELTRDRFKGGAVVAGYGGALGLDRDKGVEVDVTLGDTLQISANARANGVGYGVALKREKEIGAVKVQAEVGGSVDFQGLDEETIRAFASDIKGDFYDAPELAAGKSWQKLRPDVRAHYEAIGWNEADWEKARAMKQVNALR